VGEGELQAIPVGVIKPDGCGLRGSDEEQDGWGEDEEGQPQNDEAAGEERASKTF
jgi:hypothetical protein